MTTLGASCSAAQRARDVLQTVNLTRVNDRVLALAGELLPAELRSLDAIHLATAELLSMEFGRIVTYDGRMVEGARMLGMRVVSPSSAENKPLGSGATPSFKLGRRTSGGSSP
jgi:hypothetical protein